MHSNSFGCPKMFVPFAPVLYWLLHLTCISSLKEKNERKMLIFTQLKIFRYKKHFPAILDKFLENDLKPIYRSPTETRGVTCVSEIHSHSARRLRSGWSCVGVCDKTCQRHKLFRQIVCNHYVYTRSCHRGCSWTNADISRASSVYYPHAGLYRR